MRTPSLHNIYLDYKKEFFPKLLEDPSVITESQYEILDNKISEYIKKLESPDVPPPSV
jgi:hypothetical protein